MTQADLEQLAGRVVKMAAEQGATDAECTIAESNDFSVNVRMREVETLTEAGSRGAGLRVLVGKHTGSSYTSDLTEDGLRFMVSSAMELAKITTEDPHAGLPDPEELGFVKGDLKLYSDSVPGLPAPDKIAWAKRAEAAALDFDPRISNSEGGSFDSHTGLQVFANSRGFVSSYRYSSVAGSTVPVAKDGEGMERDYWMSIARDMGGLEKPDDIGRTAAARAIRRLGAKKVATQKVPIVFEPRVARSLLGDVFDAINGDAIYRHQSFLTGKLGEKVAAESVTVIDDGTIPGLFGTSPFDDEGVPSRRTVVIEHGVLKNYLLNTYTARKLGMKTTGNAARGITGNPGISHGNFFLEAGTKTPEEIIKGISQGFYVTELIGSGVNIVTGDYSRGAVGVWIENGELAYPVAEVTIAGTLPEMLLGIVAIGSDLQFRGSTASPTIVIGEMTVSGQ